MDNAHFVKSMSDTCDQLAVVADDPENAWCEGILHAVGQFRRDLGEYQKWAARYEDPITTLGGEAVGALRRPEPHVVTIDGLDIPVTDGRHVRVWSEGGTLHFEVTTGKG